MRAKDLFEQAEKFSEHEPERMRILTSVVELDPENTRYRYALARSYYYNKDYEKAVEQCAQLLARDARSSGALTIMGSAYFYMGKYREAIETNERALEVDPQNYYAQFNLAFACWQIDKNRARREWQKYIDMAADEPSQKGYVERAKHYLKQLE
jgi:tetratricopeptide (TPR) repeat protein